MKNAAISTVLSVVAGESKVMDCQNLIAHINDHVRGEEIRHNVVIPGNVAYYIISDVGCVEMTALQARYNILTLALQCVQAPTSAHRRAWEAFKILSNSR